MTDRSASIVGIHEYPDRLAPGKSALQIKAASAAAALEDAGLTWKDVDAVYDSGDASSFPGLGIQEYFDLHPRITDTTAVGGSSFEFHAGHARDAIRAGRANVALITYGSTARSQAFAIGTGTGAIGGAKDPASNMEIPWGQTLISNYGMVANRHMHQYGTTSEQLAEISVTTRAHAMRNPDAVRAMTDLRFRDIGEITVEDVVNGRMIADPLHRLECCMISDGGGAVVIASEEVAKSTRKKPVWILGAGEGIGFVDNKNDITISGAAQSGLAAFGEAGLSPDQMDVAMIYDSFTITVLTCLEDLGFCKKGEGGAFVEGGRLRWDRLGAPALNTDGGGLFSNHPGMRGIFLLIEAVRQLRGESTSQREGAKYAVAHGNGGRLGAVHAGGTIILGN
ncbi:thiolase domain-containing protein [soil metagenome]